VTLEPQLVRAVVTAVVAEMSGAKRQDLVSADEAVRVAAEDRLVDRIMDRLGQCAHRQGALNALE